MALPANPGDKGSIPGLVAPESAHHSYSACAPEPGNSDYWRLRTPERLLLSKRPLQREARTRQLESSPRSAQPGKSPRATETQHSHKRIKLKVKVTIAQLCLALRPHGLCSAWDSPGQNPGVGSRSLLQGIFPTQGSNPGLPHCRRILYHLSHQKKPSTLKSYIQRIPQPQANQENWLLQP